MTPSEKRHEAARYLRAARCSMTRCLAEAERLLLEADAAETEAGAERRRYVEYDIVNPEFCE
ncbi:MAG: hypothetical protein QM756_26595 [Polyangiaceae bacterium]